MKTILLADDSITIQKVVELTFSEADFRVVCVSTGGQALQKVGEVRPDIILLDVIMPEKNGYEVCEQLKRSPATSGIPVLLLTGTFEPFDKKRADMVGADGHITKPFESQVLIAKVEDLIAARPRVSVDTEGGRMDIISGGEVYSVDPARGGEGMRPSVPVPPAPPAPAPRMSADFGEAADTAVRMPPPAPPSEPASRSEDDETESRASTHPALAPPDPASGGSFVGFADVGLDTEMDDIVPDRFDSDKAPTPSTLKIKRDGVVPRRDGGAGSARSGGPSFPGGGLDDVFAGSFEAHFDLVDEAPSDVPSGAAPAAESKTGGWTPPPEAPPAETWQVAEDPVEVAPRAPERPTRASSLPEERPPAAPSRHETRGDGKGVALTPEMIDLIAEKVVERLADRVVREVAWEVVPGVAETLVRKRIKELEESGS